MSSGAAASGLVVGASSLSALIQIIEGLAPTFVEPGPRLIQPPVDGVWRQLLVIPGDLGVHSVGRIPPRVRRAGVLAFRLGATQVFVLTHELTRRPLSPVALIR